MKAVKTVKQFEQLSGLKRGARKSAVNRAIKKYNIVDGDLIADIYGSLGV